MISCDYYKWWMVVYWIKLCPFLLGDKRFLYIWSNFLQLYHGVQLTISESMMENLVASGEYHLWGDWCLYCRK